MALIITDPYKDLAKLNSELARLDSIQAQLLTVQQQVSGITIHHNLVTAQDQPVTTNNLVFIWTGATLKLSWAAGYIQDKTGLNIPVAAGTSPVLVASTTYWIYWNPIHQVMAFSATSNTLATNTNNYIVCQLVTGTAGQTGTAGGGGSEGPGYGVSTARYAIF